MQNIQNKEAELRSLVREIRWREEYLPLACGVAVASIYWLLAIGLRIPAKTESPIRLVLVLVVFAITVLPLAVFNAFGANKKIRQVQDFADTDPATVKEIGLNDLNLGIEVYEIEHLPRDTR